MDVLENLRKQIREYKLKPGMVLFVDQKTYEAACNELCDLTHQYLSEFARAELIKYAPMRLFDIKVLPLSG